MKKVNENLSIKLELLEAQISEDNKVQVNKISNLKLKNLSLAKTIEEKDNQIEAGKK
jgi:hypothetical protein